MPFEEIQHTADWCLRVWAANIAELFTEAARGMNALAGAQLAKAPCIQRTFEITMPDTESLLVAFLSELVYLAEQERLAFDSFELKIKGRTLNAKMSGTPLISINKTIKAVTYHNLQIQQTERGFEVEIVFDV